MSKRTSAMSTLPNTDFSALELPEKWVLQLSSLGKFSRITIIEPSSGNVLLKAELSPTTANSTCQDLLNSLHEATRLDKLGTLCSKHQIPDPTCRICRATFPENLDKG